MIYFVSNISYSVKLMLKRSDARVIVLFLLAFGLHQAGIYVIAINGSFGWFLLLFLGFVKIMPSISVAEVKESMPPLREESIALTREAPVSPVREEGGR